MKLTVSMRRLAGVVECEIGVGGHERAGTADLVYPAPRSNVVDVMGIGTVVLNERGFEMGDADIPWPCES
jgi:hypothetical protein